MRKNIILFTIDYETWQPSQNINWERDILQETDALLDAAEESGARFTFMIEMCEYIWLEQNNPEIANRIKKQIQNIIIKGHDVQLHLHPNWMPDTGARHSGGTWWWDESLANCNDYPGSLHGLVRTCKEKLEEIVHAVKPEYKAIAFRAGGYRVYPFSRLSKALLDNGISIDTSVYAKGISKERGCDFRCCKNLNQPYFCSLDDPQYSSRQSDFIELPITTYGNGERLFLDNDESERVAARFLSLGKLYFKNELNFFNFVGHTKACHNKQALKEAFKVLQTWPGNRYETISSCFSDIQTVTTHNAHAQNGISEIQEITGFLYNSIEPGPSEEVNVIQVLRDRTALCAGYAELFYFLSKKYGYKANRITLIAENMPNGRGPKKIDSHELVDVILNWQRITVDPTLNRIYPCGIKDLLKNPALAEIDFFRDERFLQRSYSDYSSKDFFQKVVFYYKTEGVWNFETDSRLRMLRYRLIGKMLELKNNIKHYNTHRKNK